MTDPWTWPLGTSWLMFFWGWLLIGLAAFRTGPHGYGTPGREELWPDHAGRPTWSRWIGNLSENRAFQVNEMIQRCGSWILKGEFPADATIEANKGVMKYLTQAHNRPKLAKSTCV